MLGKEVINDKPLTGEAAQMVREEGNKALTERNKENTINMTKEEAKRISEIFAAYAEGKTIQFYFEDSDEVDDCSGWSDITSLDRININNIKNYRIKPEPKYRPYKNAEEFLKAQKEHGPHLHNSYGYIIPIGVYDNTVICPDDNGHEDSFEKLKDSYTWQDGTPCGILGE